MQPGTDSLSSPSGVRKRLLPKEGENPAAFAGEHLRVAQSFLEQLNAQGGVTELLVSLYAR